LFWGTIGSIAGTLLTGFVLIPALGISAIILSTGALLGLVSVTALARYGHYPLATAVLTGVVPLALSAAFLSLVIALQGRILSADGLYGHIEVVDSTSDTGRLRSLVQDRSTSGGILLDSDGHAYPYTSFVKLFRLFTPASTRALVIGGGPFVVPTELVERQGVPDVTVAEIEPRLYDIAQQYFRAAPSSRLTVHVEDGRRLLHDSDKPYDIIFGDAYYSFLSVPSHLLTKEFFALVRERLSEGGVFIGNFPGALGGERGLFIRHIVRTVMESFERVYVFKVKKGQRPDSMTDNFIVVGHKSASFTDVKAEAQRQDIQDPFWGRVVETVLDVGDWRLDDVSPFTDDYVPAEYLVAKMLAPAPATHDESQ
jgi:spermidine synthase